MTNLEKVIKGLECLSNDEACCGFDCPYYDFNCEEKIAQDVLELLKEQEPAHVDTIYSDDFGNVLLCECGCMWVGAANSIMNYCPGCGKELK